MKNKKQNLIWKDLIEFGNNLPEEMKNCEVLIWGEEFGKTAVSVCSLEDNYISFDPVEGCQPKSSYTKEELEEYGKPDYEILKGTPIIFID